MNDLSTIVLGGRLTKDVEVCESKDGTQYARVSIAQTKRVRNMGTWSDETQYWDITVYRNGIGLLEKYGRKGAYILVTGEVKPVTYISKVTGETVKKVDVTAFNVNVVPDDPYGRYVEFRDQARSKAREEARDGNPYSPTNGTRGLEEGFEDAPF